MVNRTILFYKLVSSGWRGRVIDTFRSLYGKTHFQVKRNGRLSRPIQNNLGVNQGGISSWLMFRKYMSDLSTYLSSEVGIAISNDDLILFSDTPSGLQKQINGLLKFCSNNKIIVNEIMTKSMCFGTNENLNMSFNGKPIQQVSQYKYLGVIIRSINKVGQDLCSNNYRYIPDKSCRAVFSMKRKLKFIRSLPSSIFFDMFDTLIRPIRTYGSDVWGLSKAGLDVINKVFLNYIRCTLNVKATTCNAIVYGECGRFSLSVFCHIDVLLAMPGDRIVKSVFHTLYTLHGQGFTTWVTKAYDLAQTYNIDMSACAVIIAKQFKSLCTERTKSVFVENWHTELCDKPLLRSYRLYKNEFHTKCYLDYINVLKYRILITKIRASSHDLEIERERYTRPRTDPNQRLFLGVSRLKTKNILSISAKLTLMNAKIYT